MGVRLSYIAKVGAATIRPGIHAAWEHDYAGSRDTIYSRLAGGSRTIASDSPALGSDGAIVGGGLTVDYGSASLFFTDEYHVGRNHYSSNTVNGGIRFAF